MPESKPETYTVQVQGERFILSHHQITFDTPEDNLFVQSFLGDFLEGETKVLYLDRNPNVFRIIVDYLSDYPIFPLEANMYGNGLSVEKLQSYLLKDADYLGLIRLREKLLSKVESKVSVPRELYQSIQLLGLPKGEVIQLGCYEIR
jgi:hypothetical protein